MKTAIAERILAGCSAEWATVDDAGFRLHVDLEQDADAMSGHRRKERAAIVAKVERHTSEPDLVSLFGYEFPRNWG